MKVSKKILLFLSGFFWLVPGIILFYKGTFMLLKLPNEIFWKILLIILLSILFYFFLFFEISQKHIQRIWKFPTEKTFIWSFFSWKSYIMMVGMILLGVFLRNSEIISIRYLSIVYLTMGTQLLFASYRIFKASIVYRKR